MGYRSTIIWQDYSFQKPLPEWFKLKYEWYIYIGKQNSIVASMVESKFYWNEFFEDYQRALLEIFAFTDGYRDSFENNNSDRKYYIAVLSEGGYITRVTIGKDSIKFHLMNEGEEMEWCVIDLYL